MGKRIGKARVADELAVREAPQELYDISPLAVGELEAANYDPQQSS